MLGRSFPCCWRPSVQKQAMNTPCPAALAASLLALRAAAGAEVQFEKTQITKAFLAEGVAVADVDGDGKKDILAGFLWFQAPDWKPHELAKPKEFDPLKGYS